VIDSNHGPISCRFRDKKWLQNSTTAYLTPPSPSPRWGDSPWNFVNGAWPHRTSMMRASKTWRYVHTFKHNICIGHTVQTLRHNNIARSACTACWCAIKNDCQFSPRQVTPYMWSHSGKLEIRDSLRRPGLRTPPETRHSLP